MKSKFIFTFLLFTLSKIGFLYSQEEGEANKTIYKTFKENNKWGFKKNGSPLIQAKFEYATDFSENYALVKENGKWGYIDTLGNWFIPAIYDKGQIIQYGLAFVNVGDKTGLIQIQINELTGESFYKLLLEPIYTRIKEDYNSYYLFDGHKQGFLSKSELHFIPAIYDSIYDESGWISAKKSTNLWDLFYENKLQIEDMSSRLKSSNIVNYSSTIFAEKNHKLGVFKVGKGFIVPPKYDKIEEINSHPYKSSEGESSIIYALHAKDLSMKMDEYGEMYIPIRSYPDDIDSIYLAKTDGSLITNEVFNGIAEKIDLYSDYVMPQSLKLLQNNKIVFLEANLNLKKTNCQELTSHAYSWYYGRNENSYYILNEQLQSIDSFYRIEKFREMVRDYEGEVIDEFGNEILDENGIPYYERMYKEIEVNEPFLMVFRKNGDKEERAIYDLYDAKVISPWIPVEGDLFISREFVSDNYYNSKLIYFYEHNNQVGFYTSGMKAGTDLKYLNNYKIYGSNVYIKFLTPEQNEKFELYRLENNEMKFVSSDYDIKMASEFVTEDYVYDEIGEYYMTTVKQFQSEFMVLKQGNKYGLLAGNGVLLAPIYDSMYQRPNDVKFVTTILNGKYGSINIENGNEVKPIYSYEITFYNTFTVNDLELASTEMYPDYSEENYNEMQGSSFTLFENGKTLTSDINLIFPKKVKKRYGLFGYPINSILEKPIEEIKPQYRYLEQYKFKGLFKAQGKNKKWGVINLFGDTVLPLNYSSFSPYIYSTGVWMFKVFNGKKVGLYDVKAGEIIPPLYQEVESLTYGDGFSDYYISKLDKKYGIHDKKGNLLVNHEFEEINVFYGNESSYNSYFTARRNNKTCIIPLTITKDEAKTLNLVEYDFFNADKGYVKKGDSYDIYQLPSNKFIENLSFDKVKLDGLLFTIICQNGKFGAVDISGKVLVPCEYDYATFMEYRDEVMIGYQNGVKYYIYVENNERFTEDQW
jgi:hypothetical protein